jgi:hypothetical protein
MKSEGLEESYCIKKRVIKMGNASIFRDYAISYKKSFLILPILEIGKIQ